VLWISGYFGVALAVAIVAFVATGLLRAERIELPDHRGATSAIAGALWPAILIGIVELFILSSVGRLATRRRGSGADISMPFTQGLTRIHQPERGCASWTSMATSVGNGSGRLNGPFG